VSKQQAFPGVPGIPVGWEFLGFMEPNKGDWFLCLVNRKPCQWRYDDQGTILVAIIRKIKKTRKEVVS
jgi:hypothetical protein